VYKQDCTTNCTTKNTYIYRASNTDREYRKRYIEREGRRERGREGRTCSRDLSQTVASSKELQIPYRGECANRFRKSSRILP